jgi:hypothetical protein
VLAASPDMQVDFRWIDSSRRENWPVELGRQLAADYNVFLIGDLDAAALTRDDLQKILRRVQAGAGIGLLGGFHAFEAGGWGSSGLAPALPFEPDRLARQPFDEPVRESLHLKGPLQMLPDPRFGGVSILRVAGSDEESRRVWQSLPPLEGANTLGRLVPAAKPLAVTADGKPLLVGREYGDGRVLAFAADSTWRWVMQGAGEQHRRFWRQLVLWLAKQEDTDKDSLWVRLGQRRVSPGAALPFDAGLTKSDGTAVADVAIEAFVVSPAGQSRPINCSLASCGVGAWRMTRITSSMLATAIARPTNTWARVRDFISRCFVRRVTTSSRKAMNACRKSLRFNCSGRPPLSATMFAPNVTCRSVKRQSWFNTTSGTASRFSSMTTRMPSRLVSSQTSAMPSIFLSRIRSPSFSIITFLLT